MPLNQDNKTHKLTRSQRMKADIFLHAPRGPIATRSNSHAVQSGVQRDRTKSSSTGRTEESTEATIAFNGSSLKAFAPRCWHLAVIMALSRH